jgi:hypothetical protein
VGKASPIDAFFENLDQTQVAVGNLFPDKAVDQAAVGKCFLSQEDKRKAPEVDCRSPSKGEEVSLGDKNLAATGTCPSRACS